MNESTRSPAQPDAPAPAKSAARPAGQAAIDASGGAGVNPAWAPWPPVGTALPGPLFNQMGAPTSATEQPRAQAQRLLKPRKARHDAPETQDAAAEASPPELYAAAAGETSSAAGAAAPSSAPSGNPGSGQGVEPSPAGRFSRASIESQLMAPIQQSVPWLNTDWFGAAPTGAVGTGALLALAALGAGGGGGAGGSGSSNTTASDTSAPVLQGAAIADAAGTQLILSYNETLSSTLPATSAFQVVVDGVITTVTGVARGSDLKTVVLTLGTAVTSPKTVTVSVGDGSVIKDTSGNAASTFREQSVVITDKVAPSLLSSNAYTHAGSSVIVLRYSEGLLASSNPGAGAFAVQVDGAAASVSAVDVLGDSVRLTLATPIASASPLIQLSYTPPGNSALQDAAGNRALALGTSGGTTVTHSQDSLAPELGTEGSAAATVGQQPKLIRLTFTEALDAGSVPAASSLAVDLLSGGSTSSVGISAVKISGPVLELTLSQAVADPLAGLRVRYSPPATSPLQDWAGNDVATFDRSVATVEVVPPKLVSRRFTSDRALELTFDETLASLGAEKAAYTLTANGGAALKPVSSTVSGRTLTLTFDTAVQTGPAALLTYAAPANDPTALNQALQDATGNDSANLSHAVDTTAPELSSARTSTDGLKVELNYSESLLSPNGSGTPVIPSVSASAFRVFRGDGREATVSSVNVSGSQVQINLASALLPGDAVSVFYQAPASNIGVTNAAIQDSSGNDALSLGSLLDGRSVTNQVAPAISSALLDSQSATLDQVVVGFNEAVTGLPDKSAFTVKVGGTPQIISSVSRSGNDLVIALNSPISSNGELRVTYSRPTSNALLDADSNAVGSLDLAYGQVITGTAGTDTLAGAAGRVDYFLGSLGSDTLSGLGGKDVFVWPDSGSSGPQGWVQTLKDFGFKQGSGTLQGTTEADLLDLSQLLDGYTSGANLAPFLRFDENAGGKLILSIDHDGGGTFAPTATLVFDNVTIDSSDRLLVNSQFISHASGNLTLTDVLSHLIAQGQLAVL